MVSSDIASTLELSKGKSLPEQGVNGQTVHSITSCTEMSDLFYDMYLVFI